MKDRRNQSQIEAPKEKLRLTDGYSGVRYISGKRKKHRRGVWVYFLTATVTVISILLLLSFGVNSNGEPFLPHMSELADKIGDFFVSIGLTDLQQPSREPVSPTESDIKTDAESSLESDTEKRDLGTEKESQTLPPDTDAGAVVEDIYAFDYSSVPVGHIPILPMDLSLVQYGNTYINNSTGYDPDTGFLLNKSLKSNTGVELVSVSTQPKVLIVHTHGSEAYEKSPTTSRPSTQDESLRSTSEGDSVVGVGKIIADILNRSGVATAHCTVMHDSVQYAGAYARAEETIKNYLARYPSIKLVIDVHRDSIVRSSGEIVRPVALYEGEAAAQIMCVVGSDWEGDAYPTWENNLSLALKFRELLNGECYNICRPVYLKSHTYNQEIAPFSLLLEVGAEGNSIDEAHKSAELIAEKLVELIEMI